MRSRRASPKSRFFPDTRNGMGSPLHRTRLEIIELAILSEVLTLDRDVDRFNAMTPEGGASQSKFIPRLLFASLAVVGRRKESAWIPGIWPPSAARYQCRLHAAFPQWCRRTGCRM